MFEMNIFILIYLIAGFVYAMYLIRTGNSTIWAIPINTILGPIFILYVTWSILVKRKVPKL